MLLEYMNMEVYCGMSKELYRKSVGQIIRGIRIEKGMTLEEFGKLFGASKSSVLGWETQRSLPNPERLKQIAKIGDMTVTELLNENPLTEYTTEELQAEIDRRKKAVLQHDLTK